MERPFADTKIKNLLFFFFLQLDDDPVSRPKVQANSRILVVVIFSTCGRVKINYRVFFSNYGGLLLIKDYKKEKRHVDLAHRGRGKGEGGGAE